MSSFLLQALGLAAGGIVTSAAIPRIASIIRNAGKARGESCARNAMLVIGNLAWVTYGIFSNAYALVAMCGLNSALNTVILWATIRENRRAAALLDQRPVER
jgi:uncharacterized protein with PQ loop repeat